MLHVFEGGGSVHRPHHDARNGRRQRITTAAGARNRSGCARARDQALAAVDGLYYGTFPVRCSSPLSRSCSSIWSDMVSLACLTFAERSLFTSRNIAVNHFAAHDRLVERDSADSRPTTQSHAVLPACPLCAAARASCCATLNRRADFRERVTPGRTRERPRPHPLRSITRRTRCCGTRAQTRRGRAAP